MDNIDARQNKEESHRCKACRKKINFQAILCPFCHTRQTETPWHKISVVLQWSAGAVTIVSLIVALNTFINFYADWLEKKNTVKELTYAARWLEQSDNFYSAWELVEQALQLDPSNAQIFQYQIALAMRWLRSRSARANRKISYAEMADTVTPILYRALTSLSGKHAATVFAHLGFAKYLKSRETVVFVDINELFNKALQFEKNDIYANVFRGFWLLFEHQHKHYDEAVSHFETAINSYKNKEEQAWINEWYLYGLNLVRDTKDKQIKHDVARRLFVLANQRRITNQPIDSWRLRDNILRLFGSVRDIESNIEQLLNILMPEEYLQTLNWLTKDLGSKKTMSTEYVMARLNEGLGNNDAALTIYKELLNNNPGKQLKQHIVDAYIRITQQPPQEIFERTYMNDPIPSTGDLWRFHADSLLKFDFLWQPTNFTHALEFFQPAPDNPVLRGRVSEAMLVFAQARDRIKEWIDVREREILRGNKHAYFKKVDEKISKSNLYRLMAQYGELAYFDNDWNTAITAFDDTITRYGNDDPQLLYALARAYSQRAAIPSTTTKKEQDINAALSALTTMIDQSVKSKLNIDWEQIKTDQAFSELWTTKVYKDLIRGR